MINLMLPIGKFHKHITYNTYNICLIWKAISANVMRKKKKSHYNETLSSFRD